MATSKSTTAKTKTPPPVDGGPTGRVVLHLAGLVVFGLSLVLLSRVAKTYVRSDVAPAGGRLRIELVDRPGWMSDGLADQISALAPRTDTGVFDDGLLHRTADAVGESPWVRKVRQVRRVYVDGPGDTVRIDCDFRVPIAVVAWGDYYWLVDNDGVKLSDHFSLDELPRLLNGANIRAVTGVRQPPPEAGKKWTGADLAAGLDLVKLFYGKSYLTDVTAIDVTNFGGRVKRGDPQIVLATRFGTRVWWGRPADAKDFFVEVPVARKLRTLRAAVGQFGRVDAGRAYFDIRYEYNLVPSTEPTDPPDTSATPDGR